MIDVLVITACITLYVTMLVYALRGVPTRGKF